MGISITNPKKISDYCDLFGVTPDTMRISLSRAGFTNFDRYREPTPQELQWMTAKWATAQPAIETKQATITTPTKEKATPAKKKSGPSAFSNLNLYDALVWAEAPLLISSLYASFDKGGLLIALILSIFLEKGRQIMRTPYKPVANLSPEQYSNATEYNDDLKASKSFAFNMAIGVALFVLWSNGQFFYDHISTNRSALVASNLYGYTHADLAARAFAVLMTGITLAALRGLSLTANHRQL